MRCVSEINYDSIENYIVGTLCLDSIDDCGGVCCVQGKGNFVVLLRDTNQRLRVFTCCVLSNRGSCACVVQAHLQGAVRGVEESPLMEQLTPTSLSLSEDVWLDSSALHRQLSPRAPRRDGPERYAGFVAEGTENRGQTGVFPGARGQGARKFQSDPDFPV